MTYPRRMITKTAFTPTGPSTYGSAPGIWRMDEVAYWQKQGLWPNPSVVPDTYFPYVSLLLSSTSLSNANNNLFVDSSGAFNPVSRNGNTTQGSFTPYGSYWSNYFDGSTGYLSVNAQTALSYGTGDFTMEAWVYPTSINSGFAPVIEARASASATTYAFGLRVSAGVYKTELYTGTQYTGSTTVSLNTWTHIAVSRSSGTLRLFVNGVLDTSWSSITTSIDANAASQLIGVLRDGAGYYFPGYISNFRAVKGTAVYTANFTPPAAPLTAISGTSLLTCQSNRFIDNSSNAFAITVNGDTKVQKFSPFTLAAPGVSYNQSDITNWSGYFDGSGDYLTVPNNAALDVAAGDFTMEFWMRKDSAYTSTFKVIATSPTAVASSYEIQSHTDGTFALGINSVGNIVSYALSNFVPSVWYHIVFTRSGNAFRMFVDGVLRSYATNSINFTSGSGLAIGGLSSGRYWDGNISNLRIIKGSIPAAYQTSSTTTGTTIFTPPTSNLTAVSGTSLLTLQNAAFTDNSTNNFVITQYGNTTVSGNSPFNTTGYWGNYFNVSGYLRSTNSVFALGTGDFTMEMWVNFDKPTKTGGGQHNMMWVNYDTWGANSIFFGKHGDIGGYVALFCYNYNSGSPLLLQDPTLPTSGWMHYAVVRSGSSWKLFRNGVSVATATWSGNATSSTTSSVGGNAENGAVYGMEGYISNFRLTNTAVYSSNFTPSTTPLTAVSGTQFLTCQSSRFIDTSTNAIAITPTNSVQVQSFDPFYTATIASNGGSMYFDGNGDYLSIPNGPSVILSNSVYTLEAWVYPTGDRSAYRTIFVKRAGDPTPCAWQVSLATSTGNLIFYNGTLYNSGVAVQLNAWSHVAAVYDGTNINLYLNGSRVLQSAMTNADCNANAQIGYFFSSVQEPFLGYIANARILKGVQAYTGTSYTVPTAPANPTPNTTLMVNGMNAGIYDATTINDMETVGNAQVTTAQSKFGGSSMYFDGSGDYLNAGTNPAFAFGTAPYTVEAWVYVTGSNTENNLVCNDTTNGFDLYFNYSSNTTRLEYRGGSNIIAFNAVPTRNTWAHVALVREGTGANQTKFYLNGVSQGSGTDAVNWTISGPMLIGGIAGAAYYSGYIDDLRITKGVARYTANFTPPTQAFPTY